MNSQAGTPLWMAWRRHLATLWHEYRWPAIGAMWIATTGLGYLGFAREVARSAEEETWSVLGTLYSALQLFPLESGGNMGSGPLVWQLELARWLAPLVAAFTAMEALALIFYDHVQRLRLRRVRGHVIICGLGQKGLLLSRAFREQGHQVVVIDENEANELLQPCREHGSFVLIGDATEQSMLNKARIQVATHLISVCGPDGANAEVVAHARQLVEQDRESVLTCAAHIVDPALWYLLRKGEVNTTDALRLHFFNVFDAGARALLRTHPPFSDSDAPQGDLPESAQPHLLVVGAGRLGQGVVLNAAWQWRNNFAATARRLRVTLIDRDTEQIKEWLGLRCPELHKVCDITTCSMDVNSSEFHKAVFLLDAQGHCNVTMVYICVDDDAAALAAALALHHRLRVRKIPIVVRMTDDTGLAALLHEMGNNRSSDGLYAFGLLERTCRPDLVLGGTIEMLARAIHDKYVRDRAEAGETPDTNSALVGWNDLPEEIKESNRSEADHIGLKLQEVGCDVAPLMDWDAGSFTFTPEEVELMAKMEHERWLAERRSADWSYGPRDINKKTNPNLAPWDEIPEEARELNRSIIRRLPAFLEEVGFQVYRLQSL
jgi:hypothetical protein